MEKDQKSSVGMILQARMGSLRLPGKVMLPFGNTILLGWIINRLRKVPLPLVVATTNEPQDKKIFDYCVTTGVSCYRGSEVDVLDRYYKCALQQHFDHVIRLTGDNPFTDIEELNYLTAFHLDGGYDYCNNIDSLPVGIGVEIFSVKSLEKSWMEGRELQHREHVNEYILENPDLFKIGKVDVPCQKHSNSKFTIDTLADYELIHKYLEDLGDSHITTEKLIKRCMSSV